MPNQAQPLMRSRKPHLPPPGFTLLESIIAVAVLAILLTAGWPSLARFVTTQRGIAATNLLVGHIAATRANAVHRGRDAVLCPSQDGASCAAGIDWSAGWIVFVDPDGDRVPASTADILLVERRPADSPIRIYSTAGRNSLRYRADGYSIGSNLTLAICSAGMRLAKVVVNNSGRPRSERSLEGESCND